MDTCGGPIGQNGSSFSCPANAETAIAASTTRSDRWSYDRVKQAARAYTARQCRGAGCRPCFRMARHKTCYLADACPFCHGPHSKDEVKHPGPRQRQRAAKRRARMAQSLDAAAEDADGSGPAERENDPFLVCEKGALPKGSIEEREANIVRMVGEEIRYTSDHLEQGGGETPDFIEKVRWWRVQIDKERETVTGMLCAGDVLAQLDDVLTAFDEMADRAEQSEKRTPHPPQPLCATAKASFPKANSLNLLSKKRRHEKMSAIAAAF